MATISFTTKFDLISTTKQFAFTDTTDWAGQGIPTANVNGCFTITAPSGTIIYNNTDFSDPNCDIWINNALTSQQTIALPLVGLDVEPGVYSIQYRVFNSVTLETYTLTTEYTYSYVPVTVCIENAADCITPTFTSTDATVYVIDGVTPVLTRSHKLYYPPGNVDGATFLSSASSVITTGTFYQGTQTTTISSTVTYTFSDGLIVSDLVSGSLEELVDCTFICSIYCCIRSYETLMLSYKGVNNTLYLQYTQTFSQIMAFAGLATLAIQCGKPDDVNGYLTQISILSNCTSSCSCTGETPSRVTGLGGIVNEVIVDSGGTPIIVTSVIVGSTTTYTVTLDSTFVNTVNSLYNTIITPGYGILAPSVTVGLDTTYTLAVSLSSASAESVVEQNVTIATGVAMSGIQVVAPSTGVYAVLFEADLKGPSTLLYRLVKNIAGTPVAMSTDREIILINANESKMGVPVKTISLTAGDTLDVTIDSVSTNGKLEGRSLTIIRIA